MFERIDTRNIFKLQIDKIVLYPPYGIDARASVIISNDSFFNQMERVTLISHFLPFIYSFPLPLFHDNFLQLIPIILYRQSIDKLRNTMLRDKSKIKKLESRYITWYVKTNNNFVQCVHSFIRSTFPTFGHKMELQHER